MTYNSNSSRKKVWVGVAKVLALALCFTFVFGFVMASEISLGSLSSNGSNGTGDIANGIGAISGGTAMLPDDQYHGNIDADAFVSNGVKFPGNSTANTQTWTSGQLTYQNATYSKNNISVANQNDDKSGEYGSTAEIIGYSRDSDGKTEHAKGYTVSATYAQVNQTVGVVNLAVSPFLLSLIKENSKFSVKVDVSVIARKMNNHDNRQWQKLKFKIIKTANPYSASEDPLVNDAFTYYDEAWGGGVQTAYMKEIKKWYEDRGYSLSNNESGDGEQFNRTLELDANASNIAVVVTCGETASDNATTPFDLFRVDNIKTTFTITYNNNQDTASSHNEDGAAPKIESYSTSGAGFKTEPYRPESTIAYGWPVYSQIFAQQLDKDELYYKNTDGSINTASPRNDIKLVSYVSSPLGTINGQEYYKTYSATFLDLYGYQGCTVLNNYDTFSSGVKTIKIGDTTFNCYERCNSDFTYSTQIIEKDFTVGGTVVGRAKVSSVGGSRVRWKVDVYFYTNTTVSVVVSDYGLNDQTKLFQTIAVDGIDLATPNNVSLDLAGTELSKYMSTSALSTWFNTSSFHTAMTDNVDITTERGNSKYLWFCKVEKNIASPTIYNNVQSIIDNATYLKIQDNKAFVKLGYDFTTGKFTTSADYNSGVTGVGRYAFTFYALDLAGHIATPITYYINVDYVNPSYEITSNAPTSYFNQKVTGEVWAHNGFDLTLAIQQKVGNVYNSLRSYSGNFVLFNGVDKNHILVIKDGVIVSVDSIDFNNTNELAKFNITKINSTKFNLPDMTVEYLPDIDSIKFSYGNITAGGSIFENFDFVAKFTVGVGVDSTSTNLTYNDAAYQWKEIENKKLTSGIKIRIDQNAPMTPVLQEANNGDYFNFGLANDAFIANLKLGLRKWYTSTQGEFDISFDEEHAEDYPEKIRVYFAVVAKDKVADAQDDFLASIMSYGSYQLAFDAISSKFKELNSSAYSISTMNGKGKISLDLLTAKYGAGVRNIYAWAVDQAGNISNVQTFNVLVDSTQYAVNANLDNSYFTNSGVEFYLTDSGKTVRKDVFKRGDKIEFKFNFSGSYVPYQLLGRNKVASGADLVLFENKTTNKVFAPTTNISEIAQESQVFTFDEANQKITLLLDNESIANLQIGNSLDFTLKFRKYIDFGISGLYKDAQNHDTVKATYKLGGTDVPLFISDQLALGENGLSLTYKDDKNASIDGKPMNTGTFYASAFFNEDNLYYVSDKKFENVIFIIEKPKIKVVAKYSFSDYGQNIASSTAIGATLLGYDVYDLEGNKLNLIFANNSLILDTNKQIADYNKLVVGKYLIKENPTMLFSNQSVGASGYEMKYDVIFVSAEHTIRPKDLKIKAVNDQDTTINAMSKLYFDTDPTFYFAVDLESFAVKTQEEYGKAFKNAKFYKVDGNYVIYEDTNGCIVRRQGEEVGTYSFALDNSMFVTDENYSVSYAVIAQPSFTIKQRTGVDITLANQLIIRNLPFVLTGGNYILTLEESKNLYYTVDSLNSVLLNSAGKIDGLRFKIVAGLNVNEYKVVEIISENKNFACNPISGTPVLTVQNIQGGAEETILFFNQKQVPSFQYKTFEWSRNYLLSENALANSLSFNFADYFEIKGFQNGIQMDLTLYSYSITAKFQALPDGAMPSQYAKVGSYVMTFQNVAQNQILKNNLQQDGIKVFASNFEVKVEPLKIAINPVVDVKVESLTDASNANIDFLSRVYGSDDFVLSYQSETSSNPTAGRFVRALFDANGNFVRLANIYDDVTGVNGYLPDGSYYGIYVAEKFVSEDPNYEFVYVATTEIGKRYVTSSSQGQVEIVGGLKAQDVRFKVTQATLTINESDFKVSNKQYDGTAAYYFNNYSEVLDINGKKVNAADDVQITFDLRYDAPTVSDVRFVIASNFNLLGKDGKNYKIKLVNSLGQEVALSLDIKYKYVSIYISTLNLNDFDIVIKKEFDGNSSLSPSNVYFPADSPFAYMNYKISELANGTKPAFPTAEVSNFHKIDEIKIFIPTANVDDFNFIGNVKVEKVKGQGIYITLKDKKAIISKVKIDHTDFLSFNAIDKQYDRTTNINLSFAFVEDVYNIANIVKGIVPTLNAENLGLKFKAYSVDASGTDTSLVCATDVNGNAIPRNIRIDRNNFTVDGAAYANDYFDIDIADIASYYENSLVASISKAKIRPDIVFNSQKQYNGSALIGSNDCVIGAQKQFIRQDNNVVVTDITFDVSLSDISYSAKGLNNANVAYDEDGRLIKHNVMFKNFKVSALSADILANYEIDGYVYENGKYVSLNNLHQYGTLVPNMIVDKFEMLNHATLKPKEIYLTNSDIKVSANTYDGTTPGKVYDGTNKVDIKLNGDGGILNSEVEIVFDAKFSSVNVGENVDIIFGSGTVLKNKTNSEIDYRSNYDLSLGGISSLSAKIEQRKVKIDIRVPDKTYDGTNTMSPNFVAPTFVKADGEQQIFYGDDALYYTSVKVKRVIYPDKNVQRDENKKVVSKTGVTFEGLELQNSQFSGVVNYQIVLGEVTAKIVPKQVTVTPQASYTAETGKYVKVYDGTNKFEGVYGTDFTVDLSGVNGIIAGDDVDLKLSTNTKGYFENTSAGSTYVVFVVEDNATTPVSGADKDNYEFVRSTKKVAARIEKASILVKAEADSCVYGEVSKHTFAKLSYSYKGEKVVEKDGKLYFAKLDGAADLQRPLDGNFTLPVGKSTANNFSSFKNTYSYTLSYDALTKELKDSSSTNFKFMLASTSDATAAFQIEKAPLYVYAMSYIKKVGEANPQIDLAFSGAITSNEEGRKNGERNIFQNMPYAVFRVFNVTRNAWYDKNSYSETDKLIYAIDILNVENALAADSNYTLQLRFAVGSEDFKKAVLTVNEPSIKNLAVSSSTVTYDASNKIQSVVKGDLSMYDFIYYLGTKSGTVTNWDTTPSTLIRDAGSYMIRVFAKYKNMQDLALTNADLAKDLLVFYNQNPTYIGNKIGEGSLTINKATLGMSFTQSADLVFNPALSEVPFAYNDVNFNFANKELLQSDADYRNYYLSVVAGLLNPEKISVKYQWQVNSASTFVNVNKMLNAGRYKIILEYKPQKDGNNVEIGNFVSEVANQNYFYISPIKLYVSVSAIAEQAFEANKNYVTFAADTTKGTTATMLEGANVQCFYKGGGDQTYSSTVIEKVGKYSYAVMASKSGNIDYNYIIMNGDKSAEGTFAVGKKKLSSTNDKVTIESGENKVLIATNLSYKEIIDGGKSMFEDLYWKQLAQYVNQMQKSNPNSTLAAVVEIKVSNNNQTVTENGTALSMKVALPSNLDSLSGVEVYFVNKEGQLEKLQNYNSANGYIYYSADYIANLIFIKEQGGLPIWAIALIVIVGLLMLSGVGVGVGVAMSKKKKLKAQVASNAPNQAVNNFFEAENSSADNMQINAQEISAEEEKK